MNSLTQQSARHLLLLLALLLVALRLGSPLHGQVSAEIAAPTSAKSSLDFVPAETAFYLATSSHKQIWQAITESRAYNALKETPAGRKMRKAYRKGLSRGWEQFGENPLRYYLEGYAKSLDSVEGKMVWPYFERLLANELFVYADTKTVTFLSAFSAYYDELNTAILEAADDEDSPEIWALIQSVGEKHLSKLEVPTIVVGAIAEEPEVFIGFLELMHTGIQQLIAQDPVGMRVVSDIVRYRNEGTSTADRLAWFGFEVESDRLPWDDLSLVDPEIGPVIDAFKPFYAGKRFVVAFAVRGEAVLFTLAPSFEHLHQLGNGPLLVDQPLLEPLREARATGRTLCFASFQSAEFKRLRQASWNDWAKGAANLLNQLIAGGQSELLSEAEQLELMESIRSEALQFASEMRAFEANPQASLGFGLLAPEGIEGFSYEFDQPAENGTAQKLRLPEQLTTTPLLAIFSRDQSTAQQWQIMSKYSGKFFAGLEHYGPLLAEDLEQAESSAIVLEQLAPLLKGLSEATIGQLMPQIAGEEWGLVIDLSIARSSWHAAMPAASQPLPLPGLVLLLGFKNADIMKQVGDQYLAIARQALEDMKEFGGGEIPEGLEIPEPERAILAHGMQYSFPLPAELGLTGDWLPHVNLGERLLAIGYFPEQTARFMSSGNPQTNDTQGLAKLFGPATVAGSTNALLVVDNLQLVDAIEAWTSYGLEQAKAQGLPIGLEGPAESPDLNLNEAELRETLAAGFQFYRCFRGISARTYTESNNRVQHFLIQFRDLER
jgi:hypothetical protein